jgi:hypothetical protein
MNRWRLRGVAALALITLAMAGCQNQGADESLDTLPSLDSSGHESMDMSSPSAEPSDDM